MIPRRSATILAWLATGSAAFWFLPLGIDPLAQHALAIGVFMIAGYRRHGLWGEP